MSMIVETEGGKLEGVRDGALAIFRGIPFAKPPVGDLRFRPPAPPESWAGVRDASRYGHSAPQVKMQVDFWGGFDVGEQSEDCLYLNVVTPAADGGKRPVMVWIHGGAFTVGSGSQAMYDPRPLVRRGDVVVVSVNYRLGALGFLHLDDVAGSDFGASGNAAILDQVAALRWVRDNVGAFGGDPENVTLFGESAGGMSVGTLLGTPAAVGLFGRAIAQSGAGHRVNTAEQATFVANAMLEELGLSPGEAGRLRELPYEALLGAQTQCANRVEKGGMRRAFCPVIDGRDLPRHPIEAMRDGLSRDVAVIAGVTRDEWKLFGVLMDPRASKLDDDSLRARFEERAPGHAEHFVEAYRRAREGRAPTTPPELFFAFETDRIFRIPAIRLAEAQSAHRAPTWSYLVTWESPMMDGALGACHGIDVPFVFGLVGRKGADGFAGSGPDAERLRDGMMDAWLAFARTGDPNHAGLPAWPAYDADRRATMLLGAACGVEDDPFGREREAWDGVL